MIGDFGTTQQFNDLPRSLTVFLTGPVGGETATPIILQQAPTAPRAARSSGFLFPRQV